MAFLVAEHILVIIKMVRAAVAAITCTQGCIQGISLAIPDVPSDVVMANARSAHVTKTLLQP